MEAVMNRTMLRVAFLAVLFVAFGVATAHADTRFSIHVGVGAPVMPAPVVVAPPPYPYGGYYYAPAPYPYPGYAWRPGYYVGYRWVPGAWVPHARVAPYGRGYYKHDRYYKYDRYYKHDRRRW
jgi:hypothetical protein